MAQGKKFCQNFRRFVSILFFNIWERGEAKKTDLGFFKTCNYTFLNILKRGTQRNCARSF